MYRLKYDPAVEAVHDSLPSAVRPELTRALADACDNPLGATVPYGHDDAHVRMIDHTEAVAAVFLNHTEQSVSVLLIEYQPRVRGGRFEV